MLGEPAERAGGGPGVQRHRDDADWEGEDEPLPDSRAGARRLALEALYWEAASPGQLEDALRQRAAASDMRPDRVAFAARLARAAVDHAAELDHLISEAATHWRRDRIARVDGLVLRLGTAELLYLDDVPPRVSIYEAVELARTYGGDKSHGFVNGVLDAIARGRGIRV